MLTQTFSTWKRPIFLLQKRLLILFLNMAVLFSLPKDLSARDPPPHSEVHFCCNYCITEKTLNVCFFHWGTSLFSFFFFSLKVEWERLFVMVPLCGILFYWCSLVLWDDLYDNIMCSILLLAGDLLTWWFSYFQIRWRITHWLICKMRKSDRKSVV